VQKTNAQVNLNQVTCHSELNKKERKKENIYSTGFLFLLAECFVPNI